MLGLGLGLSKIRLGTGGSTPPPPDPGSNRVTVIADQRTTTSGDNRITVSLP